VAASVKPPAAPPSVKPPAAPPSVKPPTAPPPPQPKERDTLADMPTLQMEGGSLLGADGASGTLLLAPAEAAAAIEKALQRAATPRQLPDATLPPAPPVKRWAYALAPILVAALGIAYVAASFWK